MSTKRQLLLGGGEEDVTDRIADDYYPTPQWLIAAAMDHVDRRHDTILDAGAGDGRLAKAAEIKRGNHPSTVTAVEVNVGRTEQYPNHWDVIPANFLTWARQEKRRFSLVISNPPFKEWLRFAELCLRLRAPSGVCLVLGFANILASQNRSEWWRIHRPAKILLSSRRPQFKEGAQGGDPRDTVWIMWGPKHNPHSTLFDWV
jgi:hypothetical protein